jgi:hypothetical protein
LLGPPAASIVGLHIYFRYRRHKGKKISLSKSLIFNLPLSFFSGQWMSMVIDSSESFGIPLDDRIFLERFKETVGGLPFINLIPVEYRLLIVLTVLIIIILLPGP